MKTGEGVGLRRRCRFYFGTERDWGLGCVLREGLWCCLVTKDYSPSVSFGTYRKNPFRPWFTRVGRREYQSMDRHR